eukprot:227383_1
MVSIMLVAWGFIICVVAQNCIYTDNNTQAILNLTALNGTIITASDGVFDYAYDPCNFLISNNVCHGSGHLLVTGSPGGISGTSSSGAWCQSIYGSSYVPIVQFVPAPFPDQSFKLTFQYGYTSTQAIVYWMCSSDSYRVIDVGAFGVWSNAVYVQLRIASIYACTNPEFHLKLFLEQLNLSQHYQAFINEGFKDDDYALISKLSNDDLKELGINKMAERYRLLTRFH